jgi:hypothetical protein
MRSLEIAIVNTSALTLPCQRERGIPVVFALYPNWEIIGLEQLK